MPRLLIVPSEGAVPIVGGNPVTLAQRLELLRERKRTMDFQLQQHLPATLHRLIVDEPDVVQSLEGVGAYVADERIADELERAGLGTIVRLAFGNYGAESAPTAAPPDPWQIGGVGLSSSKRAACGTGVVVGIADSWLFDAHPDIPKAAELKAFDEQGNVVTSPPMVLSGHGSAVASLIAGRSMGIAPAATIVFASVLRQESEAMPGHFEGTAVQVAYGLDYLTKASALLPDKKTLAPVTIINASFHLEPENRYGNELKKIVDAVTSAGILLLAGTGNTGNRLVSYPARESAAVGVGALNRKGELWSETARDESKPDLWSPGVVQACGTGSTYQRWAGTSMATAVATGCAAAVLSSDPTMKTPELRTKIMAWSDAIPDGQRIDLTELP